MILDEVTIQELKTSNNKTFEKIYQETVRGVYSMVFSIIRNHTVTEDLVQDIYMRMLVKIDQYRLNSNFYNWLLQIAKHIAIDYYRKNKRTLLVDISDIDLFNRSAGETPDQSEYFMSLMNKLNQKERMIVLLKVVDEKTHQEIADMLQMKLGTVLWIYQKAIKKLGEEV
ncbi:RNA polymerase sigma factor sigX [Acholeplasma oculi]|uniref:RNA polymerase sigma-70 factor, ECF subfamily n=1 Tax=Acholeplasma oculi TaxID=35623 RepID=A0A061A901_9MOLU|nr:RNA polymerase sigma factor [Acholeplasma oculi]CDR30323.1 RNA polymerase sigma-70 factor, ECF subfamily [Acholeplasma oculi]SKC42958.1 RNA polymerase sigma-70 factor, ECF subfamily [Acholeplasma oculi]SUT88795.1 RNA polymerase sigma factor sigX [Acholeplasma oculi]